MIEAAGGAHHRRHAKRVVDDMWPLLARADREDHHLGRIDDGVELLDAVHAQVGDGRRAALIFMGLQLAVPRPGGKVLRLRRDRKSVVEGKSVSVRVDLGGRRLIKKKNRITKKDYDHRS